jgi:hypothetical protein
MFFAAGEAHETGHRGDAIVVETTIVMTIIVSTIIVRPRGFRLNALEKM